MGGKVFCKGCKFYKKKFCRNTLFNYIEYSPIEVKKIKRHDPGLNNSKNNCKEFKKKWGFLRNLNISRFNILKAQTQARHNKTPRKTLSPL